MVDAPELDQPQVQLELQRLHADRADEAVEPRRVEHAADRHWRADRPCPTPHAVTNSPTHQLTNSPTHEQLQNERQHDRREREQ
jgi:hypothetical protein